MSTPDAERQATLDRLRGLMAAPQAEAAPPTPAEPRTPRVVTDVAEAKAIALRRLTVRARSVAELRADLAARGVVGPVIDEVVTRLTEVGLLDDAAFAQAWVEERQRAAGASRARLGQELAAKGVDRDTIGAALPPATDDAGVALELARRKVRAMSGLDPVVVKRRLAGQLARRGFSDAVVYATVRQVVAELAPADGVGNIADDE